MHGSRRRSRRRGNDRRWRRSHHSLSGRYHHRLLRSRDHGGPEVVRGATVIANNLSIQFAKDLLQRRSATFLIGPQKKRGCRFWRRSRRRRWHRGRRCHHRRGSRRRNWRRKRKIEIRRIYAPLRIRRDHANRPEQKRAENVSVHGNGIKTLPSERVRGG